MSQGVGAIPDDIAALTRELIIARAKADEVEAELAVARALTSEDKALIAHQRLVIAKMQRQLYGAKAERAPRLTDQAEFEFEELQAAATEDELAAEQAVAKTTTVAAFERKTPCLLYTSPSPRD